MKPIVILLSAAMLVSVGCAGTGGLNRAADAQGGGQPTAEVTAATYQFTAAPGKKPPEGDAPLAFLGASPISHADLMTPLIEAAGGQILAEEVLDRELAGRLRKQNIKITFRETQREQEILLALMDNDPNQAQRMVDELRAARGLGDLRFSQLLYRSAAMRALVAEQVKVTDEAVRQLYDMRFGEKYEVRLIVAADLPKANELKRRAEAGELFVNLAIEHSVDASSAQGGLLDPISPADPTYPEAIRREVQRLKPGEVSNPIALEQRFALIKLERKIAPQKVPFDRMKARLSDEVKRRIEDLRMRELRSAILDEANLTILDRSLKASWERWKSQQLK